MYFNLFHSMKFATLSCITYKVLKTGFVCRYLLMYLIRIHIILTNKNSVQQLLTPSLQFIIFVSIYIHQNELIFCVYIRNEETGYFLQNYCRFLKVFAKEPIVI